MRYFANITYSLFPGGFRVNHTKSITSIRPRSAAKKDLLYVLMLCCFGCLLLLYLFDSLTTLAFSCQSPSNLLSPFLSPERQCILFNSFSFICRSVVPSLSCFFSVIKCLSWLFNFSFFFHSSHLHFTAFFSSSCLVGSLLTLLNVRAQTSPCRAAPSCRGQKQLVSLPFPCFLAASVCLTVCLPTSDPSPPPPPFICCSSQGGVQSNWHFVWGKAVLYEEMHPDCFLPFLTLPLHVFTTKLQGGALYNQAEFFLLKHIKQWVMSL